MNALNPGTVDVLQATTCTVCGTQLASGLLACPGCHSLVHGDALKDHRLRAESAAARGDTAAQLEAWRAMAELLPPTSRQHEVVMQKIAAISETMTSAASPSIPHSGIWKSLTGLGALALLIWKFKFLLVALLTKGKLLLFGLTKASTAFSMLLSFGVYWTAWGMWFAAGLVLSIYVHEMGHIAALRRFGIAATSPMFIPGLGAFIRLRTAKLTGREDAIVGLAGPLWGLGAAVAALLVSRSGGGPLWAAIAHTGAWINLFNLLPVWQLDGSRGMAALSKSHRWMMTGAFTVAWASTGDGLFVLLILASGARSLQPQSTNVVEGYQVASLFVFLIAALTAVFAVAR